MRMIIITMVTPNLIILSFNMIIYFFTAKYIIYNVIIAPTKIYTNLSLN